MKVPHNPAGIVLHADNRFDAIKAFQKFNFGVRHLN
jgi:hypothetical protein